MRSPAGPRRLGAATRISASLLRRLSVFFESTPGQDPKAAKFAFLIPGHAGFPNRVKRSEGSDTTPIQNATCFAVCALVCDFSPKAEGVPAFACESERGPFVGEVEKRDEKRSGTALVTAVLLEFPPLLDDGGSQGTGKCMYIKAWWNKRDIAGSTRLRCGRGREGPLFRRVCRCVRFFEQSRVCTRCSPLKRTLRRLWEKLKDAMKSGLKQRCDGNFRTIFAGTILSEKPNFLSRIFGRGRPFDFKEPLCKSKN